MRIEAAGKSTGIYLHIAGGDYGFFSLGGGTALRGNGQISSIMGKLSIGKGNPRHMLDVNGTSIFNGTIYQEGGNGTGLRIDHSSGNSFGVGNWGDRMEWYHVANAKQDWALLTLKCNEAGDAKFRINGYADPNGANLQVDSDASVGGMLKAKEVKVQTDVWADLVFEEDYKLRSLSELESFIGTNKHLPEIPSEKEVNKNGISVGEMNAKLLQKIEELTLYVIDLNKSVNSLKTENQRLNQEMENLRR
ncbi:hypothetical protein DF185_22695 [Marinifilum breve]|uniref:Peptidase S74 domain-containing protein n=2 Tax=Marinifilum breve TaxID=2184082 RepID=A0A2V3ZR14_9BACT|nr:hypothetical protein DF185_22695 [Marinifilum breve]